MKYEIKFHALLMLQTLLINAEIDRRDGATNTFNIINPGRMDFFNVLMTLQDITLHECANYCIMHLQCESVSYSSSSRQCELNDVEFDEFEAVTDVIGWMNYGTPVKVDGGFSDWKNVTGCSRSCGQGHVTYTRSCDNPKPQQGGANCVGDAIKTGPCFVRICPVCYGAKLNEYGEFTVPKSGSTKAIHLTHISGALDCHPSYPESKWGCSYALLHSKTNVAFTTFITNENKVILFPGTSDRAFAIKGKSIYDGEVTLKRTSSINVLEGQTLRIYYGEDLFNYANENNSGKHCVNVEIIYEK